MPVLPPVATLSAHVSSAHSPHLSLSFAHVSHKLIISILSVNFVSYDEVIPFYLS